MSSMKLSLTETNLLAQALELAENQWTEKVSALQKFVAFDPSQGLCQLKDLNPHSTKLYESLNERIALAQKIRKDLGRVSSR